MNVFQHKNPFYNIQIDMNADGKVELYVMSYEDESSVLIDIPLQQWKDIVEAVDAHLEK